MAGVNDLTAGTATRWAIAEKYAQGYADHGMGAALRIYYTRYFPLITLAVIAVVVFIAFITARGGPIDWRFAAWSGTYLFGTCAAVGGLLYNTKRLKPQVELGSNLSIVMPLEKAEQQALTRGINGKGPIPDEHLGIARSLAVQSRKNTATMLLLVPAYTYVLGPAFSSSSSFTWFYLLVPAFMITCVAFMTRSFRRQGLFLTTTTPPPQPATIA